MLRDDKNSRIRYNFLVFFTLNTGGSLMRNFHDFQSLTPQDQHIVMVLAIHYCNISIDQIFLGLKFIYQESEANLPSKEKIQARCDSLESKGFLTRVRYANVYACVPDLICPLLTAAQKQPLWLAFTDKLVNLKVKIGSAYDEDFIFWLMLIGMFFDNPALVKRGAMLYSQKRHRTIATRFADCVLSPSFPADKLVLLPEEIQQFFIITALRLTIRNAGELTFPFLSRYDPSQEQDPLLIELNICLRLLNGDFKAAGQLLETVRSKNQRCVLTAVWLFCQGNFSEAEAALAPVLTPTGGIKKCGYVFSLFVGMVLGLSYLKSTDKPRDELLEKRWNNVEDDHYDAAFLCEQMVRLCRNLAGENIGLRHLDPREYKHYMPITRLFYGMMLSWVSPEKFAEYKETSRSYWENLGRGPFTWLGFQACELGLSSGEAQSAGQAQKWVSWAPLFRQSESWDRALNRLSMLLIDSAPESAADHRLVWDLGLWRSTFIRAEMRIQKRVASGAWSSGQAMDVYRIRTRFPECVTPQDEILLLNHDHSIDLAYHINPRDQRFMRGLVGHPYVFLKENGRTVHIEVVEQPPEFGIDELDSGFQIRCPQVPDGRNTLFRPVTPDRYALTIFSDQHLDVINTLSQPDLVFPEASKARLVACVSGLSKIATVQTTLLEQAEDIAALAADPAIHVIMLPSGSGYRLDMMVQPVPGGAFYKAGKGFPQIMGTLEGARVLAKRDLAAEQATAAQLIDASALLTERNDESGEWPLFSDLECLEVLDQLYPVRELFILEWPKGKSLQIVERATLKQLNLKIKRRIDWFEVDGAVQLSEDVALHMDQLLQNLPWKGRFFRLEGDRYVAVTDELRRQIEDLKQFVSVKTGTAQVSPHALSLLEDLTQHAGHVEGDTEFEALMTRMAEARDFVPELPAGLDANLREYQITGYNWLTRMAMWDAGACLADDMGLGKTLQTLAVLLDRSADGPALVVVPASVMLNWVREMHRFTPGLIPVLLTGKERRNDVAKLKPGDVAICSYAVMQIDQAILSKTVWHTLVLDEAQAIKNTGTKRAKAVMALKSRFRIAMSGTPIENNLGELWNLFHFLIPGYLGSAESFREKFIIPIEQYKNKASRASLNRLIKPFILRRKKSDVLTELPPKTEIVKWVEMSDTEMAFYESLRKKALENLETTSGNPGQKQLRILAEITRLRQACCNSRLIVPESRIDSSKLADMLELVQELKAGGHKALIFSQFVQHLSLVKETLDAHTITYQYLDGSVPIKERQERVDAFQLGKFDVFLISLKAGGLGLNLTAADYVLMLDPWWNPAVETQAADRAHRMGQERPVTIYRLIAKGTIEEKIVALHEQKRALADDLLDGTDISGKMTVEELLALIKDA